MTSPSDFHARKAARLGQLRLDAVDFEEKFARSSGPGGQHVNKVSTAVQLRHIPSGLSVTVQDTRSQSWNRQLAWDRLLDAIERFRFSQAELDFLADEGIVDSDTLAFCASYRFKGNIWGYAEGDCYFPGSPILVVEGTFAEAVVLETVALSILNHDCAIASAASRMVTAARGRPLIEMGSRRTHERAAVASASFKYV